MWAEEQAAGGKADDDDPWGKAEDPDAWRRGGDDDDDGGNKNNDGNNNNGPSSGGYGNGMREEEVMSATVSLKSDTGGSSRKLGAGGGRGRSLSKSFISKATQGLDQSDIQWVRYKSLLMWIYLWGLSIYMSLIKRQDNNTDYLPNRIVKLIFEITLFFTTYLLILVVWCLVFRNTASLRFKGFFPWIKQDYPATMRHTLMFIIGLAGFDMCDSSVIITNTNSSSNSTSNSTRVLGLSREAVLQYKILEWTIIWFVYFLIKSCVLNHVSIGNISYWASYLPMILFGADSLLHYSWVYHKHYWHRMMMVNNNNNNSSSESSSLFSSHWLCNNCLVLFIKTRLLYFIYLFAILIDITMRSVTFASLFNEAKSKQQSIIFPLLVTGAFLLLYIFYTLILWAMTLASAAVTGSINNHNNNSLLLKNESVLFVLKKTLGGGKILLALMLCLFSCFGCLQLFPSFLPILGSISSSASNSGWKLGVKILKLECFLRLVWFLTIFTVFGNRSYLPIAVVILLVLYPYAIHTVLFDVSSSSSNVGGSKNDHSQSSPLRLLCNGGFWAVGYFDNVLLNIGGINVSNELRFNKEWDTIGTGTMNQWKYGVILVNVVNLHSVNEQYGLHNGDLALLKLYTIMALSLNGNSGGVLSEFNELCRGKIRIYKQSMRDTFIIVTGLTEYEDFKALCNELRQQCKVTLQRPYVEELADASFDDSKVYRLCDVKTQGALSEDEFGSGGATSSSGNGNGMMSDSNKAIDYGGGMGSSAAGGGAFGGGWYDSSEDDEDEDDDDGDAPAAKSGANDGGGDADAWWNESDGEDEKKQSKKKKKKKSKKKRKKHPALTKWENAPQSMEVTVRVSGIFGNDASLEKVMELEKKLRASGGDRMVLTDTAQI